MAWNAINWKLFCFVLFFQNVLLILECHFSAKFLPPQREPLCQDGAAEDKSSTENVVLKLKPMEKEMATHSSILAWKIPWTEEPGRLQPMGSQRIRHDWATSLHPGCGHSWFLGAVCPVCCLSCCWQSWDIPHFSQETLKFKEAGQLKWSHPASQWQSQFLHPWSLLACPC